MPSFLKIKSKLGMAALFKSTVVRDSSNPGDAAHAEIIEWAATSESSEDEKAEKEELQKGKQPIDVSSIPTRYSLKSGPLRRSRSENSSSSSPSISSSSCSRRRRPYQLLASTSSNSLHSSSSPTSASLQQTWHDPLLRMKALLSELASSISISKTAFGTLRASSSPRPSAADAYGKARKAMAEELQTLSDLHTRLCCLIHQHDLVMKHDYASETLTNTSSRSTNISTTSDNSLQGQDAKLKSYEGIITRFHDELQNKDAVIEALKQTLAKSILKGEKLQRRIKALEAKLSSLV